MEPREREQLLTIISQWNQNRLDLFALSQPNEVRDDNVLLFNIKVTIHLCEYIKVPAVP